MTNKDNARSIKKELSAVALLLLTLFFGVFLSRESGEYIKDGMRLAVECVIPTSLPFMIISDLYICYGKPENIRLIKVCLERFLSIPINGLAPFICGNIGGFPIGAKMVADAYVLGRLTKEEAERLISLCNNPSCAFIIGGVGLGIYKDLHIGFLLLISIYLSTVLCCIVTKPNRDKMHLSSESLEQKYNFVESVKKSGTSCISIISFISIFSLINKTIGKYVKSPILIYAFSAVLEVTNAVKIFAFSKDIPFEFSIFLSAFSLGFGGVCVGLQSTVFTSGTDLKMRKYYTLKIVEGVIAACISSLILYITK